jgi:sporulation protein YlmC with PRC-barrel domain
MAQQVTGDMRWRALTLGVILASFIMATAVDARDKSGVLKASDVIGIKVEGTDGKNLGNIKDLVLNPSDGDVQYVVLDFGGFLGIKDKYFAMPWEVLQFDQNGKKITLDVSKRDLKKAPGFDKNHWPDFTDQQQQVIIYEFYEVPIPPDAKKPGSKG